MVKRDPKEAHRRIEQSADCRKGERIRILTEPATYEVEILDPSLLIVEISSVQDLDFEDGRICRFMGCLWDNIELTRWEDAPMSMFGFLLKDCYPVVELRNRLLTLPKIYQVELGGEKFFK
ncbi:MAG: hypothetical protein ACE5G1_13405 [bacterium]